MSANPVAKFFTQRFLNVYGAPDVVNPAAFVAEYGKALGGTDASILEKASDAIVKQHRFRNWPTVGECVAMIRAIAEENAAGRVRQQWGKSNEPARREPTAESRARVAALVKSTIANLKVSGPPAPKLRPLPDVSKTAWEVKDGVGGTLRKAESVNPP